MSDRASRKYVDHPAPSVGLMTLHLLAIFITVTVMAETLNTAPSEVPAIGWAAIILAVAILCFYFWPLFTTFYTVNSEGLRVRYGPWNRHYPWSDFVTAYWQRGMFATRIGWPSITPCVRLSNGVLLKRRAKRFGLYLTPNDPKAFLLKISEFAPDLTEEAIL
jgi:hypothetical protein